MEPAAIHTYLNGLLSNGRGEVGLEVGADPGLNPSEYIQIPASLRRKVKASYPKNGSGGTVAGGGDDVTYEAGEVFVYRGNFHRVRTNGAIGEQLHMPAIPTPDSWDTEIRKFVAVNMGHIRDTEFDDKTQMWIHAVRFWALKAGMVKTSKQEECRVVPDATEQARAAIPSDWVQFIAKYSGQAWTACTARAASWRKTSHATGGDVASGFPRRWLTKEGYWSDDRDRVREREANKKHTSAFYVATHAVAVHAVLALMLPSDDHHWAKIDISYGLVKSWDVRESAHQRLAPRTQVAGASMIADAVVVLKMLLAENIAGMLVERSCADALSRLYRQLEAEGMRVASYAGWFFDGHPEAIGRIPFSQKDPAVAALVGELGSVAITYYRGTTIGQSPALASASSQLASPSAKDIWAQLARIKQGAVSPALVAAYGRIAGASTTAAIEGLVSPDRTVVTDAVATYNAEAVRLAGLFGVQNVPQVTVEQVVANADAADARAKQVAQAMS